MFTSAQAELERLAADQYQLSYWADEEGRSADASNHRLMAKAFALANKALSGEVFLTGTKRPPDGAVTEAIRARGSLPSHDAAREDSEALAGVLADAQRRAEERLAKMIQCE